MSLKFAVLGLLAERPMSGFDLIREFDVAQSVVWPAPQNEIYRSLAKLLGEALIAEKETGARGRRIYTISKAGRTALAKWIAAPTDYTLRYDPILKAGFLAALPARVRLARVEADLAFYTEQLILLKKSGKERAKTGRPDPRADVRDMAIGMYTAMAEWCRDIVKAAERGE